MKYILRGRMKQQQVLAGFSPQFEASLLLALASFCNSSWGWDLIVSECGGGWGWMDTEMAQSKYTIVCDGWKVQSFIMSCGQSRSREEFILLFQSMRCFSLSPWLTLSGCVFPLRVFNPSHLASLIEKVISTDFDSMEEEKERERETKVSEKVMRLKCW